MCDRRALLNLSFGGLALLLACGKISAELTPEIETEHFAIFGHFRTLDKFGIEKADLVQCGQWFEAVGHALHAANDGWPDVPLLAITLNRNGATGSLRRHSCPQSGRRQGPPSCRIRSGCHRRCGCGLLRRRLR